MRNTLCALILFCVCGIAVVASGGENFNAVVSRIDAAPWGASHDAVKQSLDAVLFENGEIVIAPTMLGGQKATLNHLFTPAGQLFDLSWHFMIPISEMNRAIAVNRDLVDALTGKYHAPVLSSTEGTPKDAEDVLALSPELVRVRQEFAKLLDGPVRPTKEQIDAVRGSFDFMDAMPHIFFAEENYWNAPDALVYTALFCSTDGICYFHLNTIDKKYAANEKYPTGYRVPFSYTSLDRDQDMIVKFNRPLPAGTF